MKSLHQYKKDVLKYPDLTANEEADLFYKFKDGDIEAKEKLIKSNLKHVIAYANKKTGYGIDILDLIQEGNIGLIKALKNFDPSKGVRLKYYSKYWIDSSIYEYAMKNTKIVKITESKSNKKMFFNLKKMIAKSEHFDLKEISEKMDIPYNEIVNMYTFLNNHDIELDAPSNHSDTDKFSNFDQYIEPAKSIEDEFISNEKYDIMNKALSTLSDKEYDIIKNRYLSNKKINLWDLGKKHSISGERVRQIEVNAIKKLKEEVQHGIN